MADEKEAPAYVWMDVGHVAGDLPEGVAPQHGMVAVDPGSGAVLTEQPDYPEQPEDPTAPAEDTAPAKTTSTTTKSTSS